MMVILLLSGGHLELQIGQFNRPAGITINPDDDNVYVSDTANNRVQVFDGNGNFIKNWGSLGSTNGNFARPDGIHFEPSDKSIYIADRQNHRIQVFDSDGRFITKWSTSVKPRDIDFDLSGQIYVVDKENSNVLVYKLSSVSPSTELKVENEKNKISTSTSSSSEDHAKKSQKASTDDHPKKSPKSKGKLSVSIKIAKDTITRGQRTNYYS